MNITAREYPNIALGIELLLIEKGEEAYEDHMHLLDGVQLRLNELDDKFIRLHLITVENYLEGVIEMPQTFARTMRCEVMMPTYAMCIPQVLLFIKEICK